jgi:S-adenosylhomocysteine hydrolase
VLPLAALDLRALHGESGRPRLLIEDGGLIYPAAHTGKRRPGGRVVGAVEQTTRGRTNLLHALKQRGHGDPERGLSRLKFPILSVPDCRLKGVIEPPLIARMVVNNLQALTGLLNPGVKVAVLGGGAIGQGIIEELRRVNARVVVFDPRPETRLVLAERGVALASSAIEAVRGAAFVIGASGARSITPDVLTNLDHNTFLASTSSMNYEIALDYLAAAAVEQHVLPVLTGVPAGTEGWAGTTFRLPGRGGLRDIHVLADGYPLNFHGFQGLPDPHADLVMLLVLLGAAALGARNHPQRLQQPFKPAWHRTAIDELVKDSGLVEEFLRIYHPHAAVC